MKHRASCSCGQVEIRCGGEPAMISACHCTACRKRTGSAFGVAAFFNRDDVQTGGQTSTYSRTADSGFDIVFHFCPHCGSTVYWLPARLPDKIAVALGAFSTITFEAPLKEVYTENRFSWMPPLQP